MEVYFELKRGKKEIIKFNLKTKWIHKKIWVGNIMLFFSFLFLFFFFIKKWNLSFTYKIEKKIFVDILLTQKKKKKECILQKKIAKIKWKEFYIMPT